MNDNPPVRRYRVSRAPKRIALWPASLALIGVGSAVFASMVSSRAGRYDDITALPPLAANAPMMAAQPIRQKAAPVAAPFVMRQIAPTSAPATTGSATYTPAPSRFFPTSPAAATPRPPESLGGSTLLFDFYSGRGDAGAKSGRLMQDAGTGEPFPVGPRGQDPTGDAIAAAGPPPVAVPQAAAGTSNERFANRIAGKQDQSERARQMTDLDRTVPQGAIVGAVMETALNSDLPGYARAVVTKDVLSFDGSAVLIPAGSRLIGEYNSGLAQGASRIFIVWSRLIRPDGVTISLGSPAIDDLGRGGLSGKVNRHFLQRFGSAILLSVISGGISAASSAVSRGSTIIVGTGNEATALATQALQGNDIPPTITTKQGALVRVFVARDLDFTGVRPVGR